MSVRDRYSVGAGGRLGETPAQVRELVGRFPEGPLFRRAAGSR